MASALFQSQTLVSSAADTTGCHCTCRLKGRSTELQIAQLAREELNIRPHRQPNLTYETTSIPQVRRRHHCEHSHFAAALAVRPKRSEQQAQHRPRRHLGTG